MAIFTADRGLKPEVDDSDIMWGRFRNFSPVLARATRFPITINKLEIKPAWIGLRKSMSPTLTLNSVRDPYLRIVQLPRAFD